MAFVKVRPTNDKSVTPFLQTAISTDAKLINQKNCTIDNGINHEMDAQNNSDEMKDGIVNSTNGKWYYISDTHVSEVSESKVLNSEAYLLFYERIL